MIYGDPQIHVDDDTTDRIGIRTLILSKLWQASRWPLSITELDGEKPNIPDVPGGVLFIGEQTRRERGGLRTTWSFEGINGNGKSVTFKTRGNSPDYSFEPGFSQVSIIKHPKWAQLKAEFGGQYLDGNVFWPEYITSGSGKDNGAQKSSNDGKLNPLFGHVDYFRMEGTYSYRYAAPDLGVAMAGIGTIFDSGSLPGRPPIVAGRNWLKAPTPWQRRGPVLDITEIYWLSGDGGWPPEIYGNGKSGGGSGQSGLTTSSLTTGGL